jgi:hypothetical protein
MLFNIIIFRMRTTDLGESGANTSMEEADLYNGFPATSRAWLEMFEGMGNVKDELGGFKDSFFGAFSGEVSG